MISGAEEPGAEEPGAEEPGDKEPDDGGGFAGMVGRVIGAEEPDDIGEPIV